MAVLSVRTVCTQSHDTMPCAIISVDTYSVRGISPTQAFTTLRLAFCLLCDNAHPMMHVQNS